jgi:pimeloyl-ACP methyl ester carboxylesterase
LTEQDLPLPDPTALSEERIDVGRLHLHLRIWGDGTKPPLFLLHGGRDHGRSWDWIVAALLSEHCLIVPDLRGHGDSDWAPGGGYDMLGFVGDHAALVEALAVRGFEPPFAMVGHSFGGNILLHYAAAFPERISKLVVLEGLGFSQERYDTLSARPSSQVWREALDRRLKIRARGGRVFASREEGVRRLAVLHPNLPDGVTRHLAEQALRETGEGWTWKYDPLVGQMPVRPVPPSEYGALYGAITAPTLLVYGKDSWASSPGDDGRMEAFRNAELREFDDAGHWLHHDQPRRFVRELRLFLEGNS